MEREASTGTKTARADLRLAFAGGGTGGHILPGRHLLENLSRSRSSPFRLEDLVWFAAGRSVEQRAFEGIEQDVQDASFRIEKLELERSGGGAPGLATLARRSLPATLAARRVLRRQKTQVLLGLGGFTTLPAVLAARSLRIPVALLEINAARGKATRYLAPLADRVFHAWPATMAARSAKGPRSAGDKNVWTGPPLASEFTRGAPTSDERGAAARELGFDPERPIACVLGGSQGARALNEFIAEYRRSFGAAGIQLLHQVGPGRLEENSEGDPDYRAVEYVTDVATCLTASDLAICRGGASTLAEVCGLARPAVVVPYPHAAESHQDTNASQLGAGARVVHESDLGANAAREITRLIGPEGEADRRRMSSELVGRFPVPCAGELIFDELASLAGLKRNA